jgi:hypothetical protein
VVGLLLVMLNVYTLEILSLTGDLPLAVSTSKLNKIIAFVIPGVIALYTILELLVVSIAEC